MRPTRSLPLAAAAALVAGAGLAGTASATGAEQATDDRPDVAQSTVWATQGQQEQARGTSYPDTTAMAGPERPSDLGYLGYCLDGRGVTVVVDVQDLGPRGGMDGEPIVRCAPSDQPFDGSGLDALTRAGIDVTGVVRWGFAFICRLEGRPAADEQIPTASNPGYTEMCINTPPAQAYWSYWHAPNGGDWTYSQMGVTGRDAIPGGFEGWSFSLNATATTNPQPRVAAERPLAYRLSGGSRYETAAQVALRYETGVDTVFVGTGRDFPDALTGSALAGDLEAPVLLVRPDGVPDATAEALDVLDPRRIVVLGGAGAVEEATLEALAPHAREGVERWAGSNRYLTAERVAQEYADARRVYIATGADYPDALAAAAVAGTEGAPILLTRPDSLRVEAIRALERLQPEEIVVVGGTGAVDATVLEELGAYAPTVTRVSGTNRWGTAAALSARFEPGVDVAYVATGRAFPDALTGAALAGRTKGPMLLTAPDQIPAATIAELERLQPRMVVVLGGDGSVTETVREQLEGYVVTP